MSLQHLSTAHMKKIVHTTETTQRFKYSVLTLPSLSAASPEPQDSCRMVRSSARSERVQTRRRRSASACSPGRTAGGGDRLNPASRRSLPPPCRRLPPPARGRRLPPPNRLLLSPRLLSPRPSRLLSGDLPLRFTIPSRKLRDDDPSPWRLFVRTATAPPPRTLTERLGGAPTAEPARAALRLAAAMGDGLLSALPSPTPCTTAVVTVRRNPGSEPPPPTNDPAAVDCCSSDGRRAKEAAAVLVADAEPSSDLCTGGGDSAAAAPTGSEGAADRCTLMPPRRAPSCASASEPTWEEWGGRVACLAAAAAAAAAVLTAAMSMPLSEASLKVTFCCDRVGHAAMGAGRYNDAVASACGVAPAAAAAGSADSAAPREAAAVQRGGRMAGGKAAPAAGGVLAAAGVAVTTSTNPR